MYWINAQCGGFFPPSRRLSHPRVIPCVQVARPCDRIGSVRQDTGGERAQTRRRPVPGAPPPCRPPS
ncbi:hypothetical protein RAN3_1833 [plant metagenome]|uniref:Uncharacterized protein n=1 Tax=plant metagenome TaxID=1297885 RepID=A0A484VA36_9ZZZZ